ncbi:MAG: hypothetical protein EXS13_14660 [Planctomycetes bacterium]|nr:hypothetical protein [Planctomycetota bacterium]
MPAESRPLAAAPSLPSWRARLLAPALITLGVTLLRLALELYGAPAFLASSATGGGGALIGISWLPLLFGPWFALQLRPHVESGRALFKPLAGTLLLYGLLARLPVALITVPAVLQGWGTHFDGFPFAGSATQKIGIAFGAQLVFWGGVWTVGLGLLTGYAALALRHRAPTAAR